jgi:glutamine amidotransferase
MIGVIDYKAGNLRSIETALNHLGYSYRLSDDPLILRDTAILIFPGVGEARASMNVLRERELDSMIVEFAATGKPVLGICIGCQVMLERSEERNTRCIGIVPGTVRRFQNRPGMKVPHMGWNQVHYVEEEPLFQDIPQDASFYFVHSFFPEVSDSGDIIASTDYGVNFCSGYRRGNVVAVQFHPEKSGRHGLRLLKNFIESGYRDA